MAKKKKKTNAIRLAEAAHIPYELHEYQWKEEIEDEQERLHQIQEGHLYKTIVTITKENQPIVAVLPGDCELDLKKLAKVSHQKKIELLHLKDLEKTTGYIRGGCSPIGMKKQFPTFIATQAQSMNTITVSAGMRGLQMELRPRDLAQMVNAQFADIILE